jgi:hypothetical protein
MNTTIQNLIPAALISIAAFAVGCSSGRSVEVTGEVKAADSVTLSGPISISFFEVPDEGEEADTDPLKEIEIAQPGQFTETVDEVEGDNIRIFALDDADKDGACDEGEAWAQIDAPVEEDTVKLVTLELSLAACPAAPEESEE